MGIEPSILCGHVMHKRLFPKVNGFSYGIYYLAFPLSAIRCLPISVNRFGALSFYEQDHGLRDGSDLESWARGILKTYNISEANGEIVLVTMPRVLGYVFNPVSFWICYDQDQKIRAILCEVHNTFGEVHTYLCAHPDHSEIKPDDELKGDKVFHVSPFLPREGHYTFRFDLTRRRAGFWINYHDAEGKKQLVTALNGEMRSMSAESAWYVFGRYPLVTLKAIILIHWQALKLLLKGVRYVSKPAQVPENLTATRNVTNL